MIKKIILSLAVAVFGVVCAPTASVFADPSMSDTGGGQSSPLLTQEEIVDILNKFFADCIATGSGSIFCSEQQSKLQGALSRYAAGALAVQPDPKDFMPAVLPGSYSTDTVGPNCS